MGYLTGAIETGWLLREAAAREIARQGPGLGRALLSAGAQNVMLIGGFLALARLTGLGGSGLRGDLLVYLMTGVFLFNLHAKAMFAAMSCMEALPSGRLYHVEPLIQAVGGAIGAAYLQLVSAAGLIFAHHALVDPIEADLLPALPLLASAWISGLGLGLALLRLRLSRPGPASLLAMGWMRIGMVSSGAMFLGNVLPVALLDWVVWNPLFHAVDQARGWAFVNYSPIHSLAWPIHAFAGLAIALGAVASGSKAHTSQGS